jgi:hypothetical protein
MLDHSKLVTFSIRLDSRYEDKKDVIKGMAPNSGYVHGFLSASSPVEIGSRRSVFDGCLVNPALCYTQAPYPGHGCHEMP